MRVSLKLMLLLLLAALSPARGETDAGVEEAQAGRQGVPITVAVARSRDLEVWEHSVGELESITTPVVAAEVAGRIVAVAADVGDEVDSGEVLAEIDPEDFRLARDLADADIRRLDALIRSSVAQVKRLQALKRKQSASQSDLDEAAAQLGALQAQLAGARVRKQQAERNLEKARIVSPVRGRVDRRLVSVGDYVKGGTPLFHVVTVDRLRARLPFPESLGTRLRTGLPARLGSPVAPGKRVVSTVSVIRPALESASRAIDVVVDLDNPGGWFPGASVTGDVRTGVRNDAVVVPELSVVRRPAGEVVYRVDGGTARAVPVATGIRQDGWVEILDSVRAGERLAMDGAAYLGDGVPVKVQVVPGDDGARESPAAKQPGSGEASGPPE